MMNFVLDMENVSVNNVNVIQDGLELIAVAKMLKMNVSVRTMLKGAQETENASVIDAFAIRTKTRAFSREIFAKNPHQRSNHAKSWLHMLIVGSLMLKLKIAKRLIWK